MKARSSHRCRSSGCRRRPPPRRQGLAVSTSLLTLALATAVRVSSETTSPMRSSRSTGSTRGIGSCLVRKASSSDASLRSLRNTSGGLSAAHVRGGAGNSGREEREDADGSLVTRSSSLGKSVKEALSKIVANVKTWLGVKGGATPPRARPKGRRRSKKSPNRGASGGGGGSFKKAFERTYGNMHPQFNEKSFEDATEQAWARNRLCLTYIAAERGRGSKAAKLDDAICKTLADPEVAAFIDANFVMWVPGGKSSAGTVAAAAKKVGARSLPFLGVVHTASHTDKMSLERKLKRSTVALHHCNPPPSAAQMRSWMARVLELNERLLQAELAEQRRLEEEDTINTERVEGYSKSLKDDALREVKEKHEEAQRALLEEEERKAQEAREAKEQEGVDRRERKAAELGQEPVEGEEGAVSTLMLRLADGSRVRRRFLRSDSMGKVLDWADVQGVDLEAQRLSSTFPKASFAYPHDAARTIEEAGLTKQAMLFVEQKPREASSPPLTDGGNTD